ncbi:MAG: ORF6N domain-containing protein [Mariniphaga sp.]
MTEITNIQTKIYEIRGQKVMLDFDLAELYEVETKVLNQAVKRNIKRFPEDFMFRITFEEWMSMRSHFVTALPIKRNISAMAYAFTEQGVAMLSGILNSYRAIDVNIAIMRTFVIVRQNALSHNDLIEKLSLLESKYDTQFKNVYDAINFLLQKDKQATAQSQRKRIGYKSQ